MYTHGICLHYDYINVWIFHNSFIITLGTWFHFLHVITININSVNVLLILLMCVPLHLPVQLYGTQ